MAVGLMHIVDEQTPEDGARELSLLLRMMPASRVEQRVLVIGRPPAALEIPAGTPVVRVGRRFAWPITATPDAQRVLRRERPDVLLAWSVAAAAVVRPVWPQERPVVAALSDPAEARSASRWYRSLGVGYGGVEVVCASKMVQRRLVEAGVPVHATAVIRPGVDFGELRRAREEVSRRRFGLPETGRVMLTMSPPSRAGGQFFGAWAVGILYQVWPDVSLIIPGESREQRRILRLIDGIYCPHVYRPTGYRFTPAELLAVGDALIVPALDDVPTAWLAWAMSAGVPIIGSAVPAVTEFIADRHNGFLCKPGEPHTLAIRIRRAFESDDLRRQCTETARGHAFDVFRAQRCVDEFLKVTENAAAGRTALEAVQDAAIDA